MRSVRHVFRVTSSVVFVSDGVEEAVLFYKSNSIQFKNITTFQKHLTACIH